MSIMKLNEVIFIDNLPKLDLHGYDRDYARIKVDEFIKDNYTMGIEIFTIVHGIGSGIVKESVHNALQKNKLVVEYKTFYYNSGCTIVQIENKQKID